MGLDSYIFKTTRQNAHKKIDEILAVKLTTFSVSVQNRPVYLLRTYSRCRAALYSKNML